MTMRADSTFTDDPQGSGFGAHKRRPLPDMSMTRASTGGIPIMPSAVTVTA
jgi:hypothetical protein